jgi:hypothetical protein
MRTLQELSDQAEIKDVLTRYFIGFDRRDWNMVADCFAPDPICDYHTFRVEGTDKLIATMKSLEYLRVSTHFMGNTLIDVKGDVAHSEVYAEAHLVRPTSAKEEHDHINGLRYVDEWRRINGEWKITHRIQYRDWNRDDTIPALEPRHAPAPQRAMGQVGK